MLITDCKLLDKKYWWYKIESIGEETAGADGVSKEASWGSREK